MDCNQYFQTPTQLSSIGTVVKTEFAAIGVIGSNLINVLYFAYCAVYKY